MNLMLRAWDKVPLAELRRTFVHKPGDIAWYWDREVEVMSWPSPEPGTNNVHFMVRTVPGDPGTLQEVSAFELCMIYDGPRSRELFEERVYAQYFTSRVTKDLGLPENTMDKATFLERNEEGCYKLGSVGAGWWAWRAAVMCMTGQVDRKKDNGAAKGNQA